MKIQEFNEDLDEMGSEIIYIGNRKNNIDVKYYIGIIPPPPKIKKKGESENDYKKRMQNENDSIHNIQKPYFRNQQIKLFYSKNIPVDSINNKTIEVIANINDTIPLYKKVFSYKFLIKKDSLNYLNLNPEYQKKYKNLYIENDFAYKPREEKICYLTFDDGPSTENTKRILDILQEHNVKATFFVINKEGDEAESLYKRIVKR